MCSFAHFIEKNKGIEIDSPRWEEFVSRLNLIMEFVQSVRNKKLKENLDFMDEQIIQAERAFKLKMDSLCNDTLIIIETNIVL